MYVFFVKLPNCFCFSTFKVITLICLKFEYWRTYVPILLSQKGELVLISTLFACLLVWPPGWVRYMIFSWNGWYFSCKNCVPKKKKKSVFYNKSILCVGFWYWRHPQIFCRGWWMDPSFYQNRIFWQLCGQINLFLQKCLKHPFTTGS